MRIEHGSRTRTQLVVTGMVVCGLSVAVTTHSAAATSASGPPPQDVRVASYNIAAGRGSDGFDIDQTAAALAELDAEIIALQEVDVHWGQRSLNLDLAHELADSLDMNVGFAPIYSNEPVNEGDPRAEYGVAILSEYPIIEFTNHDLSRLSTQTSDPAPTPMPGFAEAVVQAKGARVHVYSTHLDYRGDPYVREMQVADTLEILAEDGEDASQILMGDLNAVPEAPELAPLWDVVTDVWDVAGEGDGFTYPADVPVRRIDYITVSEGIEIHDAVVPDSDLSSGASDHRPVVADLALPRGVQQ